ncbi:glycosyltransferase family 4 protein [Aliiglaciecola sp. 2_MG-2023]|uniref:glycosyltransferase family 4 protein n=1 Tax=unclassified Aliiglaciecola TaxID=2593648 RepID=UPI0026E35246|nr:MULTISPECIES: glycosyltransferase family 4 protein [unclassified Aliiglaciecola]MDO6709127.1 glycosyltransferase family 4 protein [Aliiglaciecola sp. 2_MG-2023]MDO6750275.1 glycosyltransferase family 4 protein [Aliiglaciecola sp. 1_MG-2023]
MNVVGCIRGTTLHGSLGGMELAAKKLYEGLAKSDIKVTVLTSALKKNQVKPIVKYECGVEYVFLPTSTLQKYSDEYHLLMSDYFEKNLLSSTDVIHSSSAGASGLCKFEKEIPIVVTWHGTALEQELDKVYKYQYLDGKQIRATNVERLIISTILPKLNKTRKHYCSYTHHVGISNYMSDILTLYGVPQSNITTIPNSISDNFFENHNSPTKENINFVKSEKIVLGVVGRAIPEKGHKIFVKALSLLDSEKYEVLLVGAGSEAALYDDVSQKVTKLRLDHKQMPSAYKLMDLFINPTIRLSGFDLTILESLAANTKVLVSDLPQYSAFLEEHNFNKINNRMSCFSVGEPEKLAESINQIVGEKNTVLEQAMPSKKGLLSDKVMIEHYSNLFENLKSKRKGG